MQTTSATWKALWASGNAYLETALTIAGVQYTAFSAPVVTRRLMERELSVGNATSSMLDFSLIPIPAMGVPIVDRFIVNTLAAAGSDYSYTADIPKSAEVVLRMRLNDGTTQSEWLPAGTYYIANRTTDPITGLMTLKCYDAMLKAEADYTNDTAQSMTAAVAQIAAAIGVTVDSRTVINTGADYVVNPDAGMLTMRDVLGGIAAAHGGNWIITPANTLLLVPLRSATYGDGVIVDGVLSPLGVTKTQTVTGLRITMAETEIELGDTTGAVLDIDSPYITAGIASTLEAALVGLRYQPYSLPRAVYDPSCELGDYLRSKSDILSILCDETATYDLAPRGDLSAPQASDMTDEYPYVGNKARILSEAREYAAEAATALDQSLTQQDIFNRLTNNGQAQGLFIENGQLYINASYLRTGTLSADLISGGTLKSTGTAGGDSTFSLNLNTALMQMISQLDSTLNLYRRITLNAATNRINFGYKAASDSSFTDFAHIAASMTGNGFPMLDITSDNTNCSVRFGRLISGTMSRGITVPMDNAPGSKHVQVTGGLDIDGVDVMTLPLAQYFTVLGKFVYSKTTGDTEGAGKAQIQVIGKSVIVDFSVKIDKPGTGSMADVGIKISGTNSLKSLNSNIPDFTAAAGGVITFYDADGKYSSMNGYAGTGLLDTSDYNRWNFGRMYDTSGSIGAWADSRFVSGLVITGRLLGTLS